MIKSALAFTAAMCLSLSLAIAAPEIGKPAPDISLKGADGKTYNLKDFKGKFVVLEWTNKDCPFVVKAYDSKAMQDLQKKVTGDGGVWLSVISSAEGKQGYCTPEQATAQVEKVKASPTAVLIDAEGTTGKAYDAKTTPHMFIIDTKGDVVYMGAIDDKKGKNYVAAAYDEAKAGKPVTTAVTQPYGCGVKYK